ncbi:hypothetical protein DERP_003330 [Dermatophagoides pteronyssinus]|uniref:Uncharacterized protein n=1 Tax=Dermatophagoides pteronyssinus TaxID=6956 RepID=A0ABQ8JJ78_DERPT|nr:hypothetical protein DERP_003330 [Dermatophagoides pteronyssinus]
MKCIIVVWGKKMMIHFDECFFYKFSASRNETKKKFKCMISVRLHNDTMSTYTSSSDDLMNDA